MSIQYKAQERHNPINIAATKLFYISPIKSGEVGIAELARKISHSTSLTQTDISAVIIALAYAIPEQLAHGIYVKLGDLGTFRAKISSIGTDTAKELKSDIPHKVTIQFRPSMELQSRMDKMTLTKV